MELPFRWSLNGRIRHSSWNTEYRRQNHIFLKKPFLSHLIHIACLMALSHCTTAQQIWTIGPMVHFDLGRHHSPASFSLEAAYWNITAVYYSVDCGIEIQGNKIRLYSEGQTGVGLTGISIGPVLEIDPHRHATRLGFQGSCWANYGIGADYRLRFLDKKTTQSLGFYVKLPIATSGLSDGSSHTLNWNKWDEWD